MENLEKLSVQLKSLHCPMNWKLPEIIELSPEKMIEKLEAKLGETEEEGIFKWHKFVVTLMLCSEYYKNKQYDKALEKQKQCETVMNISDSKGYYEKLFHDTKAALLHVLIASECHILYASGETASLEDRLKEIPLYEEMNTQSRAALLAMQSAYSMEYGHEGNKLGLKLIEKALELNPDEGEWHFLLGRSLVRIRHVEDYISIPTDRELKALDRAYSITGNPSYLTFMATACREAANSVRCSTGAFVKEEFERADALYRTALEKTGNCSHVLSRCAFGFWKLPQPYRDPELAKDCYRKALAIAPKNVMANHIAGIISESYDRDCKKAKEYYEIAAEGGAYGAFMNLLQMKLRQEEGYDPLPDLDIMLKRFNLEPRLSQTKIHIGAAHLFLRDDLSTALDYWMVAIDTAPDGDTLKKYKCYLVNSRELLNIYEIIINETRLALKENKGNSSDKLKFQQAYDKCIEMQPELSDMALSPPQSWKEKFRITRKVSGDTHPSYGRGKRNDSLRSISNDKNVLSTNWRDRGSSEDRKSQEFGRSESYNSSCDGEENMPRSYWKERGKNDCKREKDLQLERTGSDNSSCDSKESFLGSDSREGGRTGNERGRSQEFRRSEYFSSSYDGEENIPSSDCRGRSSFRRGRGRGRSAENEYRSDQMSKRNANTNFKGSRESRLSTTESRFDSSHNSNGRGYNAASSSNRSRGRGEVKRNIDSNWRLR